MFEELNDYTEEVSWDPYELTYFEVIINEYFIWYTFLLVRVQTLRFALAEARSPGLVSRLSEKTKEKYSYAELAKVKEAAFKLRTEAISAFGSNKRYRDVRRAAVLAVGAGVFALLGIVLFWPINLAISDQQTIRLLYGTLLGLGIVGIIKSGEFVVLMLMSRTRKVNRSPMGDQG